MGSKFFEEWSGNRRWVALATAPTRRYQLTSDGFGPYKPAVKSFLRGRVDFAQLVKVYASPREGEQRYSPAEAVDAVPEKVMGNPDSDRICTSYIERQNLSIRMGMRRMTRLMNAFSKKWENLQDAYYLWFAYYNFLPSPSNSEGNSCSVGRDFRPRFNNWGDDFPFIVANSYCESRIFRAGNGQPTGLF